jgi:accessory colonization factor AcfC
MMPLPGSGTEQVSADQEITEYAIARVKDGNQYAANFCDYMKSETVADIYQQHGLQGTHTTNK